MAARTVTGTVVLPGGVVPSHASVMIELIASTTGRAVGWVPSADLGVGGRRVLECDTAGAWSVDLQPNALIDPANTVYRVTYSTSTDTQWSATFLISVPDTAGPHRVEDILSEASASMPSNALTNHIGNTSGAHAASAISFAPTGSIAATNAQAAVAEVATDAAAALAAHEADTTGVHGIADTSALVTTSTVAELVRDTMGAALVAGTNIDITVNDPGDTITIAAGSGLATDAEVTSAVSAHAAVTSGVHGISAFGATLVDDADQAAAQATLGLVPGTNVQAFDSDLAAIAALTTTTHGRALLTDADAAATRSRLALGSLATLSTITSAEITDGTIVDADVSAVAGVDGAKITQGTTSARGTLRLATSTEVQAGTDAEKALTPSAFDAGTRFLLGRQSQNEWPDGFLMYGDARAYATFPSGVSVSSADAAVGRASLICDATADRVVESAYAVAVDTADTVRISLYSRYGPGGSSGTIYAGFNALDIDGNSISPWMTATFRFPGSALTTLAAPLVAGDTTVTLTDGTGWATAADSAAVRGLAWWPYVSASGLEYASYTYTRNTAVSSYASRSGNVLTLNSAWAGATLPLGTPIMNTMTGGTYDYVTIFSPTSSWARYTNTFTSFRVGTAFVRPILLLNFSSGTQHRVCGITMRFS